MIYSKETIQPLLAKYNEALLMLDARYSQPEIDFMKDELTSLKNAVVIRSDKQELYNTLTEMSQIDISNYSREKQDAFLSAYNSAMQTLNSLDSTEEEVSSAKQSVESAKNDLESNSTKGLKAWQIILVCIGSLILMCIAQAILSGGCASVLLWLLSIIALIILLIFVPLSWWAIFLIELGIIGLITIIGCSRS